MALVSSWDKRKLESLPCWANHSPKRQTVTAILYLSGECLNSPLVSTHTCQMCQPFSLVNKSAVFILSREMNHQGQQTVWIWLYGHPDFESDYLSIFFSCTVLSKTELVIIQRKIKNRSSPVKLLFTDSSDSFFYSRLLYHSQQREEPHRLSAWADDLPTLLPTFIAQLSLVYGDRWRLNCWEIHPWVGQVRGQGGMRRRGRVCCHFHGELWSVFIIIAM